MSKTTETQIEKSRLLINGFKSHMEELAVYGIRPEQMEAMSSALSELHEAGKEADAIKALLSAATKRVNDIMATVKTDYQEKKHIIKLNYPQEKWMDYGVPDKR